MLEHARSRGFVGRGAELAAFDRAVTRARDATPVVVLVVGEAGIGKTTLVRQAAQRADLPLHLGRCVPMGGDVIPLAPLADLLRQVARHAGDVSIPRAALAPFARWSGSDDDAVDPVETGSSLFTDVLELVCALASSEPLAIGFEDLHWADSVTLDLFEFLARSLVDERVVLVGTHRTDDPTADARRRRLAALAQLPGATRIHLDGLGRTDVAIQVGDLLGAAAAPQLIDEVLTRGRGNPFFTEELVAAHVTGESIPAVLSDLIVAEVDALDGAARQILAAVSVIGRPTDHGLLQFVAALDDDGVERAVRAALDAHLLVVDRESDTYRVRHALIGEVVDTGLLPPERARLHGRVADALLKQPSTVLARPDRAGELAFHLDRAGRLEAALAASLVAADAAEAVAPASALGHLERAFELWDRAGSSMDEPARALRLWQAAELAAGAAGNERAVVLARAAIEFGPPPDGVARGHERLARYLWGAGRLDESRAELERAVSLLPARRGAESAPVLAGLAQAELMGGHYLAAEEWCVRALEAAGSPEVDVPSWVMARRVQGVVRSCLGDPAGGVVLCREAWRSAPTALGRALATLYLCVALLDAGDDAECVEVARDAVAHGHLAGLDASYGGYTDALAAEGLLRHGRWADAADLVARHADHSTLPVGVLRVARVQAVLAARRGEADQALAALAVASAQPIDGWHRSVLDRTVAEVHLALGGWPQAIAAAQRGAAHNPPTVVLWSARFAMLGIEAEVEQVLDALGGLPAVEVSAVATRLRRRLDEVQAAADARSPGGVCLDTAAHLDHAAATLTRLTSPDPDAWASTARHWDELGDRWWTAVARLREAEAAAGTGAMDGAAVALREAHRLASELGSEPLLAQVGAASRRLRLSTDLPDRVELGPSAIEHLGLTAREAEVLALVAAGRTNRQIGAELYISEKTASVHVSNILRKVGVTSRVDAAAVAQRLGIG